MYNKTTGSGLGGNSGILPIHETKKYKSFPKLVSLMSNPFTKSGLNIGIN